MMPGGTTSTRLMGVSRNRTSMFPPLPRIAMCPELLRLTLHYTQIGQNLRRRLIHGQQVVAGVAVLRDTLAVLGVVSAIVAAEAAGVVGVPDVDRVRAPGNFHFGKDVAVPDGQHLFGGGRDFGLPLGVDRRVVVLVVLEEIGRAHV